MKYNKIQLIDLGLNEILASQSVDNLLPAKIALKVHQIKTAIDPHVKELNEAKRALIKKFEKATMNDPDFKKELEELLDQEVTVNIHTKILISELGDFKLPVNIFDYLADYIDTNN